MKPYFITKLEKDPTPEGDFYVPKKSNFEKKFPGKTPMLNLQGLKDHIFSALKSKGIILQNKHIPDGNWDEFMAINRQYIKDVDAAINRLIDRLLPETLKVCTEDTVIQKGGDGIHSVKNSSGDGSKSISISMTDITGKYSKESLSKVRGHRGKGSSKNPELFETYRARVSVLRSNCRALVFKETGEFVYTEKEIDEITNLWTKNYNLKFNTNFEPYYSRRIHGSVRDGNKK